MTDPVRVLRGRADAITADREGARRLLEFAADGERAVRVWIPHRQVAFGRRDARSEGYDDAQAAARERGFRPVERDVGGRAVAFDGATTIAFARAEPVADFRRGTGERYDRLTANVAGVLERLGLEPVANEPPDSFCPGAHSLSIRADGDLRKVAGIAQRVRSDAALVAGILLVDGREGIAAVLAAVYGALGIGFDPATIGHLARDPDHVRGLLEDALVGDAPATIVRVDDARTRSRIDDATRSRSWIDDPTGNDDRRTDRT